MIWVQTPGADNNNENLLATAARSQILMNFGNWLPHWKLVVDEPSFEGSFWFYTQVVWCNDLTSVQILHVAWRKSCHTVEMSFPTGYIGMVTNTRVFICVPSQCCIWLQQFNYIYFESTRVLRILQILEYRNYWKCNR